MIECQPDRVPVGPGAYVLEFRLDRPVVIRAGALGRVVVGPGVVRYYGNARGPGGLRARVARHLDPDQRRDRWHVDALTRRLTVDRVLIEPDGDECQLVRRDLESGEWWVAVARFGSSDCHRCPSHLLAKGIPSQ